MWDIIQSYNIASGIQNSVGALQSYSIATGMKPASRVEFITKRFICFAVSLLVGLLGR